ncbi:MAG TPA: NHLP family bacteriocin export ABC transporter peptidase/permease/ATPase subunit [Longimicrobium sp.]|jgi:NHLM bacteriocin system ABC transporter peptidase/ATP-binding protein
MQLLLKAPVAGPEAGSGKRVRVATVLQMEAVECGAASLAMILAHFGRYVPLEELRVACGISRDGSKASYLLQAARGYGLVARGYKKEPGELRAMRMPMVLHWNLNHFVVLEGFGKGVVHLNDPAAGSTTVTDEEFNSSFTGVALAFEPGPGFQRGGRRHTMAGALVPRMRGTSAGLLFVVLTGLALVIPGLVVPTFSRVFVDSVIVRSLYGWVTPLLMLMAATALVQAFLVWLQEHYLLRLETKVALKTSGQFVWHVLRLPYSFFSQRFAGDLATRVAINDRVARLLSTEMATTMLDIFLIAFYAVLMVQYDVLLTAIGVGTAVLNLAALQYMSRRRVDLNQRLLQERSRLMGVSMGGLQSIETLKATGSESEFFSRWSGQMSKLLVSGQDMALTTYTLACIPVFLASLNTALILGVGGLRVIEGELSIGLLIAFQALALAFITPVNRMVGMGSALQEVKGSLMRLDDVLDSPPDPLVVVDAPRASGGTKLSGRVEIRNLTFGYNRREQPLVRGFSLTLEPGSRVALVGKSGSGKSTVGKLVSGLFEPWEGEILFDGRTRAEIPRGILTSSLAVVDQEVFLFEGTVRQNLALWDDTLSEVDLAQAARDACIHEIIAARPHGYASPMEEGGRNFSGGQRQRLEIARALAINPTLLVLDEATSALDATTEAQIDDNLRRRGCSCLIVAHRLSTIRDCDEIIVMHQGEIAQRGTHAQLAAVPGLYQDLIAQE